MYRLERTTLMSHGAHGSGAAAPHVPCPLSVPMQLIPVAALQHWLPWPAWQRPPRATHEVDGGVAQTSEADASVCGRQLPAQQSSVFWQLVPLAWHGASAQYARCDFCPLTIAWLTSVNAGWLVSFPAPPGEIAVTQSFFGYGTPGYASARVLEKTTQ
jgi:hypothetical protein